MELTVNPFAIALVMHWRVACNLCNLTISVKSLISPRYFMISGQNCIRRNHAIVSVKVLEIYVVLNAKVTITNANCLFFIHK